MGSFIFIGGSNKNAGISVSETVGKNADENNGMQAIQDLSSWNNEMLEMPVIHQNADQND